MGKLAKALKGESLGAMLQVSGVGLVSCIIQRDEGRAPTRHCFQWSLDLQHFSEEPLLRHVEPPLSNLLELVPLCPEPSMCGSYVQEARKHFMSLFMIESDYDLQTF